MGIDNWTWNLSPLEQSDDGDVADRALFASAGWQAIRMKPEGDGLGLRSSLAAQWLLAVHGLAVPEECTAALTAIAEGRESSGNTAPVATAMYRLAETLLKESERRSMRYDRIRGIRPIL